VTDRIRTDFPRVAREIEHTWIPPSDGTRLAARIWTPKDAAEDPFPRSSSTCPTARTTPLDASENGGRIFSRDWTFTIPRDHV
jgi:predicted acyl esterase